MSNNSHVVQALEYLRNVDSEQLDEDAKRVHEQAIDDVETLVEHIEQGETAEGGDESLPETPDWWADEDKWSDRVEAAYREAGIPKSEGTITTKTIDGLEYYCLQWQEDNTTTRQYIGPVDPS
jgi:hypothetical protein